MGSKVLFTQVHTSASLEQVVDTLAQTVTPLGGTVAKLNDTLQINGGKEGVQFGFAADFDSQTIVQKTAADTYNITMNIHWKMNTLTIICLIVGFFVFGILWIIPLLYLFIDPTTAYNNSLILLQSKLPNPT
jgi:hypothetical protein